MASINGTGGSPSSVQSVLHYIYDPFCGWCYAAAPLVKAAARISGLEIVMHGGGMFAGPNSQTISPQLRQYVMPHDQRIAQMTGQPFGTAYFDGLLKQTGTVLDSESPIAAILAAQSVSGKGLAMLHALQHAHYVDGRVITEQAVQLDLARSLSLDLPAFEHALAQAKSSVTQQHIRESRQLLGDVGGQGFPTFALKIETGDPSDGPHALDFGSFLGRPDDWQQALEQLIQSRISEAGLGSGDTPSCNVEGGPGSCVF